jgi:glycolate oxidase FAD binding subunit
MAISPAAGDTTSQTLEEIVGLSNYHPWQTLAATWRDRLHESIFPGTEIFGIVYPGTPAELATVVAWAAQNHWSILPCGAGSKLTWGGLIRQPADQQATQKSAPLLVVSTQRMNRLIDHAIGDLTVTVEAGMPIAELQKTLAAAGQFLAIDSSYPDAATIGGIIATADTGSLRQRYNSVRDMLLGLSFVRADGQMVKAGGRVVKNVAGYDLMKLLTGSYGTLGIITQATVRVYPLAEASQTVILSGEADAIAQAMQTLLLSALTPTCLDLLSASVISGLQGATGMGLAIRFQTIQSSVQEQVKRVIEVGQAIGLSSTTYAATEDATLWQRLRERMVPDSQAAAIACKIGLRASEAVTLFRQIDTLAPSAWAGQLHAASGLGRLVIPTASLKSFTLVQIRQCCQEKGGFLSVLQAPIAFKQQLDVWGYTGNALNVMRGIKQQFDPNRLLSPHRFVAGL